MIRKGIEVEEMSKSASDEPEHNPEHGRRHRGPKKQSPNGKGKRPRKSHSWREVIHIETTDNSPESLHQFNRFICGEVVPRNCIIHKMWEPKWSNDGEAKRRIVKIDITVHSSVSGGQRSDLMKKLRAMYGIKRTTTLEDKASWLVIREPQESLNWILVDKLGNPL